MIISFLLNSLKLLIIHAKFYAGQFDLRNLTKCRSNFFMRPKFPFRERVTRKFRVSEIT